MARSSTRKARFKKVVRDRSVWGDQRWRVARGELKRGRGRPRPKLFLVVAEKLPFESINIVTSAMRALAKKRGWKEVRGVYVAHDSMGYARYVGRGLIFQRLKARKRAQSLELSYYSFYVLKTREQEREVESLLTRVGGPLLEFNKRKRRANIKAGDVRDFEAGTHFFERQRKRGRR